MPPKIFLTGATGYIGGSILHTLTTAHPSYFITVLLRRIPDTFKTTYPNITIVQGDYDSSDILTQTAKNSDIVIHCGDSDHVSSLTALIDGLITKHAATGVKGHLIHLSGSGLVADWQSTPDLGIKSNKIWSDVDSLDEIRALPSTALHRPTEKILHYHMQENSEKISIAIMCPPDIYGHGLGPGKRQSALIPIFVREILTSKDKRAFFYKEGTNTRSWVHVKDLMRLYMHVVEAAASDSDCLNDNAYFFASTQEHTHFSLAVAVGRILHAHGYISDATPKEVELEEIDGMANLPGFPRLGRYLFASNSRTRAERARKVFGWEGREEGLLDGGELEEDVLDAVKSLSL